MAYESEGRGCTDLGKTAALRAQNLEATVQLPSGPSPYVIRKLRRPFGAISSSFLCGGLNGITHGAVSAVGTCVH